MVIGGDWCSEGRGFEWHHRILDGHVFTYICCKNCLFEKTKIKEKRGCYCPFKNLYNVLLLKLSKQINGLRVVVVAQLKTRWLTIPEVPVSNPINSNLNWTIVYYLLFVEKTKIKKKRSGMTYQKNKWVIILKTTHR